MANDDKKSAHTPGPWDHSDYQNYGPGKSRTIEIRAAVEGHPVTVAECHRYFWGSHKPTPKAYGQYEDGIMEANARLIAAAPNLVNAAEAAVKILRHNCKSAASPAIALLLGAIAKAKGT